MVQRSEPLAKMAMGMNPTSLPITETWSFAWD